MVTAWFARSWHLAWIWVRLRPEVGSARNCARRLSRSLVCRLLSRSPKLSGCAVSVATTTWYASATALQVAEQLLLVAVATLVARRSTRSCSVTETTWKPIAIAVQFAHLVVRAVARLIAVMTGPCSSPRFHFTLNTDLVFVTSVELTWLTA